jgi:isopentenyldiphosphate isomerase
MSEEFLDIVDENNNLTGESAPRSKVHAEGLWHRTVHIYLFRKNNGGIDFLTHLRSPLKDLWPNTWDTRFGGHLKSGMDLAEGVASEMKEETGLVINAADLLEGMWRKSDEFPNREFSRTYYLEYNDSLDNLKFDDGEVQKVKWMNSEEIKKSIADNSDGWSASLDGFVEISDYLMQKI